jgi:Tfp pilus assembly protein PilF
VTEGARLLKARRLEDAEAVFRSVLELHPTSAVARYSLATIHYARGEHVQATEELLKVLEIDPGSVDARYSLAIVHGKLGEHDQAELQLQEVLRLAPDHERARTALDNLKDTGR